MSRQRTWSKALTAYSLRSSVRCSIVFGLLTIAHLDDNCAFPGPGRHGFSKNCVSDATWAWMGIQILLACRRDREDVDD